MIPPILITGCARSGTSMVAGIIDRCYSFGGNTTGPTNWNKKGQYENDEIRENIVKPYLHLMGCDPKGQNPLPRRDNLLHITNLRDKIESVMKYSGYKDGSWYYKGAKMCLVWPEWNKAFPDAKWIIVRRKDEDIVSSCLNTGFMNAFQEAYLWQRWVDWHKVCIDEMKQHCRNIVEVWPTQFVEGDFTGIKKAISDIGLEWNEKEIKKFIAPELWGRSHGK